MGLREMEKKIGQIHDDLCQAILEKNIAKVFKIKTTYKKIFVVSFITFIISSSFMFIFLKQNNNLFFTRWFKSAGFYAVLYDIIIVTSLFIVNNYTKSELISLLDIHYC